MLSSLTPTILARDGERIGVADPRGSDAAAAGY